MKAKITSNLAFIAIFFVILQINIPTVSADLSINENIKFTQDAKTGIEENYKLYWIFFTDKGDHNELEKLEIKAKILENLHPNSIKRRLKIEGKTLENIIDETDFPVAEKYIERIINFSDDIKLREKTKWHNGISVEIKKNAQDRKSVV